MQDIDELDDFDLPLASYEVWVLGYNRFDILTSFELLVGSFTNPDSAVDIAKKLTATEIEAAQTVLDEIEYFSVEVETVVSLSAAETSNVGTIYKRSLKNIMPARDIYICDTDYELTNTGNLKITNVGNAYKVGDLLNLRFKEKTDVPPVLLKVIATDAAIIICEFMD